MPSLNLDLNFFDHPKIKRLRGLIGSTGEVYLIRLWAYAGRYHADDGILRKYSPGEIESFVGWTGKPGAMLQAMLKVGFLKKGRFGLIIHDFDEHQGHLRIFKERAKIAAAHRWGLDKDKDTFSHPHATSNATSNATEPRKQCSYSAVQYNARQKRGEASSDILSNKDKDNKAPTLIQVFELAEKEKLTLDAEDFFNHYEALGWKVNGQPISKWQAVARRWSKENCEHPHADQAVTAGGDCRPWHRDEKTGEIIYE